MVSTFPLDGAVQLDNIVFYTGPPNKRAPAPTAAHERSMLKQTSARNAGKDTAGEVDLTAALSTVTHEGEPMYFMEPLSVAFDPY